MIGYRIATDPPALVGPDAPLLEYTLAGNGVLVHAKREGLEALIPIGCCDVRGLHVVDPHVHLERRVPRAFLSRMLGRAREVCAERPLEVLFHLVPGEMGWDLVEPPQEATATSVRPLPGASTTSQALIEIHSHHGMGAFFSATDDEDEQGFRIYGVLGTIFTRPTLRLRVGVHGHFFPLKATEVFA
ncbi:MAG: Mov34/MPN/PAD-1 family protein [Acidobacteriota bacterium]